jgi:hypothetical protein
MEYEYFQIQYKVKFSNCTCLFKWIVRSHASSNKVEGYLKMKLEELINNLTLT